jgi:hypothetical protein
VNFPLFIYKALVYNVLYRSITPPVQTGAAMNTQLHPMFQKIVNGAVRDPSMLAQTERDTYAAKLRQHDWHFEYSDDGRVYRRGRAEREELCKLQATLDADWQIWNAHCDPLFRRVAG